MPYRSIKYRIYPSSEQSVLFVKTFGCCRKIWNLMLTDKKLFFLENGMMLSTRPAQYKTKYSFLKEVDSLALNNVQLNLERTFKWFLRNPQFGFPRFKSAKRSKKSYTTNNQRGSIALLEKGIKLPKVGVVKAKIHRRPQKDWKLKSATIVQEADGKFYASVLFNYVNVCKKKTLNFTERIVGLDFKSNGLFIDSNGNVGSDHKFFRESENKLAKEQRKLKNKIPGSKNYEKQRKQIAKIHKKIANQRKDHLHKLSREIANQFDVVCTEDLNLKMMANKSFGIGKAIMDNGFGMLLRMLSYKIEDQGGYLLKIDKWYPSSQICSQCGERNKHALNEKIYHCSNCGCAIDRDFNAAINIKNEGLRLLQDSI